MRARDRSAIARAHGDPLAAASSSRCSTCGSAAAGVPGPHGGLDEVGELQRGDLQERRVDEGFQPVVAVAVVALGQVAHGEGGDSRGVDAGEPHRQAGIRDRLDLRAGCAAPGEEGGVDHLLGVVADGATQLADLGDPLPGRPRGAALELREGHDPQRRVEHLRGAGVASRGGDLVEERTAGHGIPQRSGERDADDGVAHQFHGRKGAELVDDPTHQRHGLLVGQHDEGAQRSEHGGGKAVLQGSTLAEPRARGRPASHPRRAARPGG